MLNPDTIRELNALNDYASEHYGPFRDIAHGFGALSLEFHEVHEAAQRRDIASLRRELMDVANVATRWAEALWV